MLLQYYSKFVIVRKKMFEIIFDEKIKEIREFIEYLEDLKKNKTRNKNDKIRFNKIVAYLNKLGEYGTWMGMPFTRHLESGIWELRPLNDRILYALVENNKLILLNYFVKKSRKTPKNEIRTAKKNLEQFLQRGGENENME